MDQSTQYSRRNSDDAPPPYELAILMPKPFSEENPYKPSTLQIQDEFSVRHRAEENAMPSRTAADYHVDNEQCIPSSEITLDIQHYPRDEADKIVRVNLIRKVCKVLALQFLVTIGIIALRFFIKDSNDPIITTISIIIYGVIFTQLVVIMCCDNLYRRYPLFLGFFTVTQAMGIANLINDSEKIEIILVAVVATVLACSLLTINAFRTKRDFTTKSGMLTFGVILLFVFALCLIFFIGSFFFDLILYVFGVCAVVLLSYLLVYDTQMLIGGQKHEFYHSPEEYTYAALKIYLDISLYFVTILKLILRLPTLAGHI